MLKILPLVVFLALVGFLAKGLTLDPAELPSPLIDKPAPAFELARLTDADVPFDSADMRGRVWLLNVWASWCAPCVEEHPVIVAFADESDVPVVGLNYKDDPEAATQWLSRLGNPFDAIADDRKGDVGIDWGVYGVPETFVIDTEGRVRYKHVGPLDDEDMPCRTMVIPLVEQLQQAATAS